MGETRNDNAYQIQYRVIIGISEDNNNAQQMSDKSHIMEFPPHAGIAGKKSDSIYKGRYHWFWKEARALQQVIS